MVQDNPYFDLDTVVIGLPPFISACIGGIVALIFTYQISCVSMDLDTKGDPARVKMAAALIKLNEAIAKGATAFLFKEYTYLVMVASVLFVLVSIVVNWRTGLWYV
jgi:Na+/H+-translocating membrane pyrophosphatase